MEQYLMYGIIAVGVFTLYMATVNVLRKTQKRKRLDINDLSSLEQYQAEQNTQSPLGAFCQSLMDKSGISATKQRTMGMELACAGINGKYAAAYLYCFKKFIQPIFVLIAFGIILAAVTTPEITKLDRALNFMLGGLLLLLGLSGTKIYVANLRQRRQANLIQEFPDALDLLLVCVESGLGLDAAIGRVCREIKDTHPTMFQEFDRTRLEMTVMSDRKQALKNFSDRTGITPIKSLVGSLIQTEKLGTNLSETLRILSDEQRNNRLMRAETKAARIPVLITIPLIFCIMPAFIMIILGPPFVKLTAQGGIMGNASSGKK